MAREVSMTSTLRVSAFSQPTGLHERNGFETFRSSFTSQFVNRTDGYSRER